MDPTNPNILYVAEADDVDAIYMLAKSTDGGANWTTTGQFAIINLAFDPTDHNTLYAGSDDGFYQFQGANNLWKSLDGGNDWSPIGLGNASLTTFAIDPGNPNVLYAGTERVTLLDPKGFPGLVPRASTAVSLGPELKTVWRVYSAPVSRLTTMLIDPSNTSVLYAGTSGSGVFQEHRWWRKLASLQ